MKGKQPALEHMLPLLFVRHKVKRCALALHHLFFTGYGSDQQARALGFKGHVGVVICMEKNEPQF